MARLVIEGITEEMRDRIEVLLSCMEGDGIGNFSDGYHTFNELYHHRAVLFAALCNGNPDFAWKSKQHHDPNEPMHEGMFIVGLQTPYGQATYHYDIDPYWDMFHVQELEAAPMWDGHTPDEAIARIGKFHAGMDEYIPFDCEGSHTIRVTLMYHEYTGHIIYSIGGNCRGKEVMDFDFECETEFDTPFAHNDCSLAYHDEGDYFTARLHNAEGGVLDVEGDADEMNQMIVGIEIIGCTPV